MKIEINRSKRIGQKWVLYVDGIAIRWNDLLKLIDVAICIEEVNKGGWPLRARMLSRILGTYYKETKNGFIVKRETKGDEIFNRLYRKFEPDRITVKEMGNDVEMFISFKRRKIER